MAKKSKKKTQSTPSKRTSSKTTKKISLQQRVTGHIRDFMSRRPHRSFRMTPRRDYARSLKLPGYWEFTGKVFDVLKKNRTQLLIIGLLYIVASVIFLGLNSQSSFSELRGIATEFGSELSNGDWSAVGQAAVLTITTVTGAISPELTEVQQVYSVVLGLLLWLVVVWLLRQRMAGVKVKVRDALYNAGAPIIPMAVISLVLFIQLIPVALVLIAYAAAQSSGLITGGVEAMMFWFAAAGMATLSLYWITATSMALIIVTIPGVYPFRALRLAGDMVVGRRLRLIYRLLWMALLTLIAWAITLGVAILIDMGIKGLWPVIEWLPLVPVVVALLTGASLIWVITYVYVLYREVVDDDTKPA